MTFLKSLMLVVMATCVWTSAFAQDAKEAGKVVAEVDGTKLTMGDYEAKHPTALFHARNVYFQSERKALSDFVDEYLLERQAEREHVTVDQLLEQHVRGTVKDPSEEALHVFYEGADTPQPYEAVRNQILEQIRQGRFAKAKAAYVKTLRESSNVTLRLEPPRVPVSLKDAALHGSMQAPVTMVEFGDYECPYCKGVEPMLSKLQAQYGPKLAIAYKDAPLPMHNLAKKAAEAAHCAGEQGKYWEYHDRLFSTRQLETPQLKEHARALKLNAEQFDKCLDSGSQSALVDAQLEEAQKFQVEGTPTFFINGRLYSGAFTVEQFSAVINEELGAVAAGSVSATAAMGK